MKTFTGEQHKNVVGYTQVREAGRDYQTFSSALQGDRDVRDYRQLPLEADPPEHTDYRHAIQPLFLRPRLESHAPAFRQLAETLLTDVNGEEPLDVYFELALPYVVGCLGVIYNRPQDVGRWQSWGHDVWTAESHSRSGSTLHAYLEEVWAEKSTDDVWAYIKSSNPLGARLTKEEFFGYSSVLLAGGRDTVIKLITGIVWHLLNNRQDLVAVQQDSELERNLISELLRFLSPLPAIERLKPNEFDMENPVYYRLHFASANHDPEVWASPFEIDIRRGRQPHLAFGYGPHTCIGMNLAEYEAKAFCRAFVEVATQFSLVDWEVELSEVDGYKYVSNLNKVKIVRNGS
jgi:cytochrome P450